MSAGKNITFLTHRQSAATRMTEGSQVFKAVQIFGITSSTFLSGFAFSASYLGLPALALSPVSLRLRQWLLIYDLGKLVSPTLAAASTVAWTHITYVSYTGKLLGTSILGIPRWMLYGMAGLATFGILPWTAVFMMPTNNELMRRASLERRSEVDEADNVETEKLLKTWNQMNYLRAVLPMVGVVVGLRTALN